MANLFSKIKEFFNHKNYERERQRYITLQGQMSPHFLYNAINDIICIAIENGDSEEVQNSLRNLALYERFFADYFEGDAINISDEILILKKYLELIKLQTKNVNIQVRYDENIIKNSNITIPPLTIQPLVENAIKYSGVVNNVKNGKIIVDIVTTDKNTVKIIVEDNGEGFKNTFGDGKKHIGLTNLSDRLKCVNGRLEIINKTDIGETGTRCVITLKNRGGGGKYNQPIISL